MAELCDSLRTAPILRTFVQYLIAFCSRPETAGDVLSAIFVRMIVRDKFVKFRDPGLNRSWEIPPEAVEGGIFDRFLKTSITANRK